MTRAAVWPLCLAFLLALRPTVSHATSNPSYDDAMASCQAYEATENFDGLSARIVPCASYVYDYNGTGGTPRYAIEAKHESYINGTWQLENGYDAAFVYSGTAPSLCESRTSYKFGWENSSPSGSAVSVCKSGCQYVPQTDGIDGPVQHCTRFSDGSMECRSFGMMVPNGQECEGGPGNITAPPPEPPPPKLCGGASCYDPITNTDCAVNGSGVQVCRPRGGSGDPGGCITGGDTTICTGNPPPAPPPSAVPDPPTDLTATQQNTDQNVGPNGPTGPITSITTNNYNNGSGGAPPGGNTANPGGGTGDVKDPGPSSSSSTGGNGDGTRASGGGDCGTPPLIVGSGGLQSIAFQTWRTRCDMEASKLGTGQVGTLGELYTPDPDSTGSVVAQFQADIQSAPIGKAVADYFNVGGAGGSCPVWTLPANDWMPEQTFDFYCRSELGDLLDLAKYVVLISCAYVAFRIAMGDA